MKDIKVKEERGKAELPKMVRHAPKEFVRRRLATAKEKGIVQLMQAAQNGTRNSADTEDGMRPDAQTGVDSSVELVEDTVAGGKELLRHLPSRENGVRQDEYRDNRRRWKDYAAHMEKRLQAVEQSKRIAAETDLGCAGTQRRNIRGPKTGKLLFKEPGRQGKAARSAQGMAKQAVHISKKAVRKIQHTARAAAKTAKPAGKALANTAKACVAALKSVVAALIAGGGVALAVILLICLIALVAGSSFGIFFSAEPTGKGMTLKQAVQVLNTEYYEQIRYIEASVPHDRVEYIFPDGSVSIRWEDVLAVFAADVAADEHGAQVVALDKGQLQKLREVLGDMHRLDYSTRMEEHEETVITTDEDGGEITDTVTVAETILEFEVTHKATAEMAVAYGFTPRQNEQLALLTGQEYTALWMTLLGGYVNSGGQIIEPNTDWVGTGIFAWPLPQSFTITSPFGYRKDPFTGEVTYHSGTDIAAPAGTPILAAAAGMVTIANGTDPWGGSYGYYIKLGHGEGIETLYAHCSAIAVTANQQVRQGEVIGYVGTTGNSTGNHLHFEVWINGERKDAMSCFS
ncbi:M23 family metallopeptidase [Ruthenibacterium lactatiformans]|uniref:M23 family metallopeptidase n=1 Tax=Ruthenibacterium lactatiformans TaxID=1550024 RepID=UPI003AF15DA2